MSTPLERALAFLQSLKNFLLTGGSLVDQNSSNIRADICAKCHANVACETARPAKKSICASCSKFVENAAVRLAKAAILQGRQTPSNHLLKCCGICGCDNQLSVWFPTVPLGVNEENKNAFPTFCWKKEITL